MSRPYLLDTNAVAHLIRGDAPALDAALEAHELLISVISEAELRFGLARRPKATRLAKSVEALLTACTVLPWTSSTAQHCAHLRARIEALGFTLSAMDMLIAAHAVERDAILISADRAFAKIPDLTVLDWNAARR